VFSYIYLDNLSPAKQSGFWAGGGRNELTVDNFLLYFSSMISTLNHRNRGKVIFLVIFLG